MQEARPPPAGSRFTKPKLNDPPSRHLFVSGMGSALGHELTAVHDYFDRFGALDGSPILSDGDASSSSSSSSSSCFPSCGVELVENARYCFVSYVDINSAIQAFNVLGGHGISLQEFGGVKVCVRYASLAVPNTNPSANSLIECTSSTNDVHIEGLHVYPDFLSEEDEEELLATIGNENDSAWLDDLTRRVQHYGFIFNYRTLMLDYATQINPIPSNCDSHLDRIDEEVKNLYAHSPLSERSSIRDPATGNLFYPGGDHRRPLPFTQLTVNEYYPGQGIAAHIDTESCLGPDIAVLCLGSGVTMTMQHRKAMSLLVKSTKVGAEPTAVALKSKEPKGPKPTPTPPKYKERGDRKRLKKLLKKGILPPGTTSLPSPDDALDEIGDGEGDDEIGKEDGANLDMAGGLKSAVASESDGSKSDQTPCDSNNNVNINSSSDSSSNNNNDSNSNIIEASSTPESSDASGEALHVESLAKKHVWLPRRCLLIIRGEARYFWSHQIAPRKCDRLPGIADLVPRERRVSLTFRQVLVPNEIPACRLISSKLETDNVFNVYDSIAVHWNHTRGKRKVYWHKVKEFIENLGEGSIVADVGCGDGKYFGVNPKITVIGCDRSLKLLEVSKESSHNTFCCDAVKLPLLSNAFDATLCIAVMHHLATVDRRSSVIRELIRITRPGGEIMIQAWAKEQEGEGRFQFDDPLNNDSQDIFVPWKLNEKYVIPEGPPGNAGSQVPSKGSILADSNSADSSMSSTATCNNNNNIISSDSNRNDNNNSSSSSSSSFGSASSSDKARLKSAPAIDPSVGTGPDDKYVVFQRYCHVYKKGELEDICSSIPGNRLVESGWDKGNWFIRLLKVEDDRLNEARLGPVSAVPTLASRLG